MYSGLPLYFKILFSQRKVSILLREKLIAKFIRGVNNTTTHLNGNNCSNVFELILMLDKIIALNKLRSKNKL